MANHNTAPTPRFGEWQPEASAPRNTTVIAYGAGGQRFMRKDALGQWRNMMHRPRQTPSLWMPKPADPDPT